MATKTLLTAGAPYTIRLTPDRATLSASPNDLAFVTVEVVDERGVVVTTAAHQVTFNVTGAASLAATGNGDPQNTFSPQSACQPVHWGVAMAVLRPRLGQTGSVLLVARAQGLVEATVALKVE